jgi:hypothetical protein
MGVLAYEMMTGRLPFPDAVGPAPLISAQLKRTPEAPSTVHPRGGIPRSVDALILRMLAKDRTHRFADVTALRDECLRILAAENSGLLQIPGAQALPAQPGQPTAPGAMPARVAPRGPATPARVPGPATQAIIEATSPRRTWIWVVVALLVVAGGAIGAALALK